ncbi:MAG: alpha/beta fold hydrolase [Bacteroidota bacterium]
MPTNFTHTTDAGNTLNLTVYGAEKFGDQPCVVYLHGFKGFKDWGFVPYAGRYFAERGFTFVTFNFSHNGIGDDPLVISELDKFEKNTFSLEVAEAKEVYRLCAHTDFFGAYLNLHKIGVIGHSRGGGIALLSGESTPEISAVATWAAVSTYDRYDKKTRQAWHKRGHGEVVNGRTGEVYRLGMDLLEDIEKRSKNSLNILDAARRMEKPLLLLHGEKDVTVPYYEAEQLNIYAPPATTEMRLIPDTGHTFGAVHPFEQTTPQLEQLLEASSDFFDQHLR